MDWDNLRYFLELARSGTLVGAARRLGWTTPRWRGAYRRWKSKWARPCLRARPGGTS